MKYYVDSATGTPWQFGDTTQRREDGTFFYTVEGDRLPGVYGPDVLVPAVYAPDIVIPEHQEPDTIDQDGNTVPGVLVPEHTEPGPLVTPEHTEPGPLIEQGALIEYPISAPTTLVEVTLAEFQAAQAPKPEKILADNTSTRDFLLAIALQAIGGLAVLTNPALTDPVDPADTAKLAEWVKFRTDVKAVDLTQLEPAWPTRPA